MKTILSALLFLPLAAGLCGAQTLEDALRQALWRQWAGVARKSRVEPPQPLPVPAGLKYVDIDACWTRPEDARADAAGLPAKFCIKRVALINPVPGTLPFSQGSEMVVEGEPAAGRLHISGGAGQKDHWNIVGDLFGAAKAPACGSLNHSFAAVYVDVDLKGGLLADQKPEVRGFLVDDSSYECRARAPAVEILYSRVP